MRAKLERKIGPFALVLACFGCSDPGASDADVRVDRSEGTNRPDRGGDERSGGDGAGGRLEPSSGDHVVLDVPISECKPLVFESCDVVYPAGGVSALHRLQRMGPRWVAEGVWDSGFVTFDADGGHASEALVKTGTLDRAAASAEDVHVATIEDGRLVHQRYDASGHRLGDPIPVSNEVPDEIAIGRLDDVALVLWSTPTNVVARGVGRTGISGEAFHLEDDVWKDGFRASVARKDEDELAIAWSDRRVADSHHRVFFARADGDGLRGLPRTLVDSLVTHRVVDLERTESGFALLVQERDGALVMPLTSFGDSAGPNHRFLGISRVYGLAVHASGEMLLAALREDGRDAVVRLDASGAPRGAWMCLDTHPSGKEHSVALESTEGGYAVLFRSPLEQQLLFRLKASGP